MFNDGTLHIVLLIVGGGKATNAGVGGLNRWLRLGFLLALLLRVIVWKVTHGIILLRLYGHIFLLVLCRCAVNKLG